MVLLRYRSPGHRGPEQSLINGDGLKPVLTAQAAVGLEHFFIELVAELDADGAAREPAHNGAKHRARGGARRARDRADGVAQSGATGSTDGPADGASGGANGAPDLAAIAAGNNAVGITSRA